MEQSLLSTIILQTDDIPPVFRGVEFKMLPPSEGASIAVAQYIGLADEPGILYAEVNITCFLDNELALRKYKRLTNGIPGENLPRLGESSLLLTENSRLGSGLLNSTVIFKRLLSIVYMRAFVPPHTHRYGNIYFAPELLQEYALVIDSRLLQW